MLQAIESALYRNMNAFSKESKTNAFKLGLNTLTFGSSGDTLFQFCLVLKLNAASPCVVSGSYSVNIPLKCCGPKPRCGVLVQEKNANIYSASDGPIYGLYEQRNMFRFFCCGQNPSCRVQNELQLFDALFIESKGRFSNLVEMTAWIRFSWSFWDTNSLYLWFLRTMTQYLQICAMVVSACAHFSFPRCSSTCGMWDAAIKPCTHDWWHGQSLHKLDVQIERHLSILEVRNDREGAPPQHLEKKG